MMTVPGVGVVVWVGGIGVKMRGLLVGGPPLALGLAVWLTARGGPSVVVRVGVDGGVELGVVWVGVGGVVGGLVSCCRCSSRAALLLARLLARCLALFSFNLSFRASDDLAESGPASGKRLGPGTWPSLLRGWVCWKLVKKACQRPAAVGGPEGLSALLPAPKANIGVVIDVVVVVVVVMVVVGIPPPR